MTLGTFHAPHLGRSVKLGRKRPIGRSPRLHLHNYLKVAPEVPAAVDYSPAANEALRDVMGNDRLGDCVIAAGYHVVGTETGNAGNLFHAQPPQILGDYSAIGGYVQGDPSTDNGCSEIDAFNYWTSHGFANGTKLLAWLALNPQNKAEIQAAMYLFENLYLTAELPYPWLSPFPSADGFVWDVAGSPVPTNGHAIMAFGYDSRGVKFDTWGLYGWFTYEAIATYCEQDRGGGVYALLTPDQLAKGQAKAPNGMAWAELLDDWNKMGGHVPMPAPSPFPPIPNPMPSPAAPVTLDQAQQWAVAGLAANWPKS